MKEVTNLMVNCYGMREKGPDFMGYQIDRMGSLQFHHLIIAKRNCQKERIPQEGYVKWNGAILIPESHAYLHQIEIYNKELFYLITCEMIDENMKGRIDRENLIAIRKLLEEFDQEYKGYTTRKGTPIVKSEFVSKRLILK